MCDGGTDGQTLGVNEAVAVLFSGFLFFVEKHLLHWQCYLKRVPVSHAMVINELRGRNSASVPSVRGFGLQVHLKWKFHPRSATGISPLVQLKLWLMNLPNVTGVGLTVPI